MLLYDPMRISALLDAHGADGLLAVSPRHVRYFTMFPKVGGTLALVMRNSLTKPILIVPSVSLDFILEELAETTEVHAYGQFIRNITEGQELDEREKRIAYLHEHTHHNQNRDSCAADVLKTHNLEAATILTDAILGEFDGLSQLLPSLKLIPDALAFKKLRMVKTAEEIRRLSELAKITEQAIAETIAQVAEGTSQAHLARCFHLALAGQGAELRLANISFGRSAAFGNANIPEDLLLPGQIIRFDVGAIKAGYVSDMSRCFAFHEPGEREKHIYAALHAGQQAALAGLHPGMQANEVFEIAMKAARRAGLPGYERTNVGHGIGLLGDGYDLPQLAPGDHTVLEPGMVLCVETPYYEIGFGGLQVEDMVVMTDDKPKFLTTSRNDLQVII
jgi:Xaa-Pro aminopeptidase